MVNLPEDLEGPIFVFYTLSNFYQNHRRYYKSRNTKQLNGTWQEFGSLWSCNPVIRVGDLWDYQKKNLNNVTMPDNQTAVPCGLVAKSFFNDTFRIYKTEDMK